MDDNRPKIVTMKDIAYELGITTDAVSKALRDCRDISEATKEKVRKVANELGYIPNTIAQNLRKKTSNTISLVFNDFYNPYFSVFLHRIYGKLNEKGYECQLIYCNTTKMNMNDVKNIMINNFCAIVSFVEPTDEVANFFKNRHMPFTLIGINTSNSFIDCIYTDDFLGGQMVGNYFINSQYDNALYVSNSLSETSERRLSGFLDACKCNKNIFQILYDQFNEEYVLQIIKEKNIDFMFCFSDSLALQIKSYLKKNKYKEKIKIIGFDNLHEFYPLMQYIDSVGSNVDELVSFAADITIKKLKKEIDLNTRIVKIFPTYLIIKK